MKIGIIGLPKSGKTTIFNSLTRQNVAVSSFATGRAGPNIGIAKAPDPRVDALSDMFKPKKTTYSTVEYIDMAGLSSGLSKDADAQKGLAPIKDVDALIHVVRSFEDESVPHSLGKVDPLRDIQTLELELILYDHSLIEKRLEKLEAQVKKGQKIPEDEKKLLLRCIEELEKETPLRALVFSAEEDKILRAYQFLSIRPELLILNIGEKDAGSVMAETLSDQIRAILKGKETDLISLSGKIEMEISQLDPSETLEFLKELNIDEPALNRVIRASFDLLNIIPFFTVGEDEVRSWIIRKGMPAPKAGGKIHSDIERGFIRAEVIAYNDLISSGSMARAREKGLVRLEGKTYIIKDGDIAEFRFNV